MRHEGFGQISAPTVGVGASPPTTNGRKAKEKTDRRQRSLRKREIPNGTIAAKEVFVSARVAQAILQINSNYLARLKREGKIKGSDKPNEYNLADVLERYQYALRSQGLLAREIESNCIRDFEAGKLPIEVIIEHGYAYDIVKQAWDHFVVMKKDPDIARVEEERTVATKKEEATRCRDCLRTRSVAEEDTRRVLLEVTGDPERTNFNIAEERVLVGIDMRCPSCRALKATAPIESIRARLRVLAVVGLPQPIDVDKDMPLPTPPDDAAVAR